MRPQHDYPPRVRAKYDLPLWLKDELEAAARDPRVDTSTSQLAAFLLALGLHQLRARPRTLAELQENRSPARSLRFSCNVDIPEKWHPDSVPVDGDS